MLCAVLLWDVIDMGKATRKRHRSHVYRRHLRSEHRFDLIARLDALDDRKQTASGSRYTARPLDFPVINCRTDVLMMLPNPPETLPCLRLRRFLVYSNC